MKNQDHLSSETLFNFVYGQEDPEHDYDSIAKHLENCSICQEKLKEVRAFRDFENDYGPQALGKAIARRIEENLEKKNVRPVQSPGKRMAKEELKNKIRARIAEERRETYKMLGIEPPANPLFDSAAAMDQPAQSPSSETGKVILFPEPGSNFQLMAAKSADVDVVSAQTFGVGVNQANNQCFPFSVYCTIEKTWHEKGELRINTDAQVKAFRSIGQENMDVEFAAPDEQLKNKILSVFKTCAVLKQLDLPHRSIDIDIDHSFPTYDLKSLMLSVIISVVCAATATPDPSKYCFSGKVLPDGKLEKIGSIDVKIKSDVEKTLVVPSDNYQQLKKIDERNGSDLSNQAIGYETLAEVLNLLEINPKKHVLDPKDKKVKALSKWKKFAAAAITIPIILTLWIVMKEPPQDKHLKQNVQKVASLIHSGRPQDLDKAVKLALLIHPSHLAEFVSVFNDVAPKIYQDINSKYRTQAEELLEKYKEFFYTHEKTNPQKLAAVLPQMNANARNICKSYGFDFSRCQFLTEIDTFIADN
ncbi:hypothetical protein Dalk_2119 [Desulfatibacillum aliphaticivorans]|uniref:Uncharacterized protein n=1 Tax=Desulfatibacillum aliphaticivorans TaxID=218208 RepID=B8FGD3_DESAL|nr:hypothetical protein [Desulfatibacillum aliphaticivorans]ACL03813.1 hypothetical protein Dalk_2119 [Desulfatibacillum aliphaticivorans]